MKWARGSSLGSRRAGINCLNSKPPHETLGKTFKREIGTKLRNKNTCRIWLANCQTSTILLLALLWLWLSLAKFKPAPICKTQNLRTNLGIFCKSNLARETFVSLRSLDVEFWPPCKSTGGRRSRLFYPAIYKEWTVNRLKNDYLNIMSLGTPAWLPMDLAGILVNTLL